MDHLRQQKGPLSPDASLFFTFEGLTQISADTGRPVLEPTVARQFIADLARSPLGQAGVVTFGGPGAREIVTDRPGVQLHVLHPATIQVGGGNFVAINQRPGAPGTVVGGAMADLGLGFSALPRGSAGSAQQFGGFGDTVLQLAGLAGQFFSGERSQFVGPMNTGGGGGQVQQMQGDCAPRVARIRAEVRPDPCGKSPRIWMDMGAVDKALPQRAFTFHRQVNKLAKKAARPARRKRGRR